MGPTWALSDPDGPHVAPWTLLSGLAIASWVPDGTKPSHMRMRIHRQYDLQGRITLLVVQKVIGVNQLRLSWVYKESVFSGISISTITRPTLERWYTLGHLRSINPNTINHFASQSQTCQLLKIFFFSLRLDWWGSTSDLKLPLFKYMYK